MKKLTALLTLALVVGALSTRAGAVDPKPNILLVIGDDAGYPFYGFMGHPYVQTPALDGLAAQGTLFPVAQLVSSICRPSNAGILTGRHAKDFPLIKKDLDPAVPTIANLLSQAGYVSLHTGKSWPGGHTDKEQAYGFTEIDHASEHIIGRFTLQPIYDFVDAHVGTPWFIWYAPFIPHTPNQPPDDLVALYANIPEKRQVKSYYAAMSQLDRTVGDILAFLESRGERDNTIVIYLSDNGYLLPKSKGNWSENGFRTPVVIYDPRTPTPGGVRTEMVHAVDILPTILDYAGAAMPSGPYDGLSLRHFAENQAGPQHTYLMGHFVKKFGNGLEKRHLRSQDSLKMYLTCNGKVKLYDLNTDPNERHKLDPAQYAARITEFKAALDGWWNPC